MKKKAALSPPHASGGPKSELKFHLKRIFVCYGQIRVMAHAGLRLGEALAMRVEYFDPPRKTYTVCQGYKRRRFKKPKGGKTRVVDLPEYLADEMDQYVRSLKK